MKRWVPHVLIALVGTALLLLLWLVLAPRKPKPVEAQQPHASQTTPPSATAVSAAPTVTSIHDPSPVNTSDETPINENIVPTGHRSSETRASLETVSGPEIGPGLTPGAVLENMRSVIRDYGARFGSNPFGNNREITAKLN